MVRSDFLRHSAIVFGSTMAVNALNYAFHFIVSRHLGVSAYGAVSSLLAALSIFSIPGAILTMIVVKYAAEFHALDDRAHLRALSARAIQITGGLCFVMLAVAVFEAGSIAGFLRISDVRLVWLTCLSLCASLMMPGARGVLQGVQDFKRFGATLVIEGTVKMLLGVGLVFAGLGTLGAVIGFAAASWFSFGYAAWAVRRHFGGAPVRLYLDGARLVQTMGGIATANICIVVLSFVDVLLVKHYFDATTAGLFGAVALAGKVFLFVGTFLPTIVLPKAAVVAMSGASPLKVLARALGITAVVSALGLAVYLAAPLLILHIMVGPAYAAAVSYVFPYACAMSLLALTNLVITYKIGLHRFDFALPLLAVTLGEIGAIVIAHDTLWSIVRVVLIGHGLALCVSLYRANVYSFQSTVKVSERSAA